MYFNALNRFIHTCSKQKVDVSRYFFEKTQLLFRFPELFPKNCQLPGESVKFDPVFCVEPQAW